MTCSARILTPSVPHALLGFLHFPTYGYRTCFDRPSWQSARLGQRKIERPAPRETAISQPRRPPCIRKIDKYYRQKISQKHPCPGTRTRAETNSNHCNNRVSKTTTPCLLSGSLSSPSFSDGTFFAGRTRLSCARETRNTRLMRAGDSKQYPPRRVHHHDRVLL